MATAKPKIFLIAILVAFLVPSHLWAHMLFSGSGPGRALKGLSQRSDIVHVVQRNENLWKIAQRFDVHLNQLIRLNGIKNPNLIFPGEKLLIEVREDNSVVVKLDASMAEPIRTEVRVRVTYPDRNDIFSPEVPVAVYEKKESPRFQNPSRSEVPIKVFQNVLEFVEWLSAELGFPVPAKATGAHQTDSGSAPIFLASPANPIPGVPNNWHPFNVSNSFFKSLALDSLSPPPKSA